MGGGILTFIIFVIISQALELFCMFVQIPESIYRMLFFRYFFLLYLAYIWTTNKICKSLKPYQIILSLASVTFLIILNFTTFSLKPILHDSDWRASHWMVYFWVAFMLPWLMWKIYDHIPIRIKYYISVFGKYSYEIFLVQMVIFTFMNASWFGKDILGIICFISVSVILSIFPVLIYKLKLKKIILNYGFKK